MHGNEAAQPKSSTLQDTIYPVEDTIRTRHSVRSYLSTPVPQATIARVLETASYAPSGSNFQPWKVYVLTGATLARVGNAVQSAFLADEPNHTRDYAYYPPEIFDPFRARRRECGVGLYGVLNIGRDEKERMKEQRSKNYVFFNAPMALLFTLDARLETGSFLDYGFFIQSIMLAARELGLDTCTQASISEYPDVVRRELGLAPTERILCGMAVGYGNASDDVNGFSPSRASVEDFATFLD